MADGELPYEDEDEQSARPARLAGPDWTGGPVAGRRGPVRHPEAVSAAITAVVEWRLMIEANTCVTHWQNGVGIEKLEINSNNQKEIRSD